jgi:hypothetical protein
MSRRTCGHGRLLTHPCPACIMRVRPDQYWELWKECRRREWRRRKRNGVR